MNNVTQIYVAVYRNKPIMISIIILSKRLQSIFDLYALFTSLWKIALVTYYSFQLNVLILLWPEITLMWNQQWKTPRY